MRSSVSRSIKRFAQNDPFARYRDDDALAQLVRETMARTPAPWGSLLGEVAGLDGLSEDAARILWTEGVQHRRQLSRLLGRPVLLRVALLDLLSADPRFSGTPGPVLLPRPLLAEAAEGLTTDELTGLKTREHLLVLLEHELARRGDRRPALAFIDFDDFKQVNDSAGHAQGDELLRTFGGVLRQHLRAGDVGARLGGDEFAVLFPESDLDVAQAALNRVAEALYAARFPVGLSVGLVVARAGESAEALLKRADTAMYRRKKGRARKAPPASPPAPQPVQRPLTVFATRNARLFREVHTAFANLGLPLVPAVTPGVSDLLLKLFQPELLLADLMLPPRGGDALLKALHDAGVSFRTALLAPERFSRVRTTGPWATVRMRRGPGALEGAVKTRLFPAYQPLPPLPPLESLEVGQALARRVVQLCKSKGRLPDPPEGVDARPELDLLRLHLGS